MADAAAGGAGGGIVSKVTRALVPTLIIVGGLVYFGVLSPGPSAPDFIKPTPKV